MALSPRIPTFTIASMLLALAVSGVAAQDPGAPGQYDAGRAREGERERHRSMITDDQLEGPPYPEFVTMRFELDSVESTGYRQIYDSFMVATKPQRDSATTAKGGAGRGGEMDLFDRLGDELVKQESKFDKRVKSVLHSDHYKAYKQWKDEQRKQAEAQQQQSRPREPSP